MGPKRDTSRKHHEILDAAVREFQAVGYENTSMDRIAESAGASKRTVYNHFTSKEKLLSHLLDEMWERAQQAIHVKYDPLKPLDIQLLIMIGAEIEALCKREYMDLARVAAGYYFYQPRAMKAGFKRMANQETSLLRWLRVATEDGRLVIGSPDFAASQLHDLVRGKCFWPQLLGIEPIPGRDEQRHLAEETVSIFLARYGAAETQ